MKQFNLKLKSYLVIEVISIIVIGLVILVVIANRNNSTVHTVTEKGSTRIAETKVTIEPQRTLNIETTSKINAQPIETVSPQKAPILKNEENTTKTVVSIQGEQQTKNIKPTQPPKPVTSDEITNKNKKPTYTEQEVKPQQSQPNNGEKNEKGQIYVKGFGWIKDEGGGGKGTTVNGMKENGNKIGNMN